MSVPRPNPMVDASPDTDSDQWTCILCFKSISEFRPPTLDLSNCSCSETGTMSNPYGEPTVRSVGNRAEQPQSSMETYQDIGFQSQDSLATTGSRVEDAGRTHGERRGTAKAREQSATLEPKEFQHELKQCVPASAIHTPSYYPTDVSWCGATKGKGSIMSDALNNSVMSASMMSAQSDLVNGVGDWAAGSMGLGREFVVDELMAD
jgi:hypothetical protein